MNSETEAHVFKRITTLEERSAKQETEIDSLKNEIRILKERMTCLKDEHHPTGKSKSFKEAEESAGDRVRRLQASRKKSHEG